MKHVPTALVLLCLVSCGALRGPVRLSIPDIKILTFEARDEPIVLGRVVEERLAAALAGSGRFSVSTREGAGAEWILHATLEESAQGMFDTEPPSSLCEVVLQARVIRAESGEVLYSRSHKASAVGRSRADFARLTEEATRRAADQLAKDLIELLRNGE